MIAQSYTPLIGIWLEERKLLNKIGPDYAAYCEQVGMLFPRIGGRKQDRRE